MKPAKVEYVTNLYPLIDYKIDGEECKTIIKKAGLPVPVKSGCHLCQFNNMERWANIYEKHPDLYKFAIKIEENGKHFGSQGPAPGKYTLRELEAILTKEKLPTMQTDNPCGGECVV